MKTFLFRSIPERAHAQWKHFAKMHGHSMRVYLMTALIQKIDRDKVGGKNVSKRD